MCGNVGIINNETNWAVSTKLVKFFQQALHVDALRGVDGTGLAAIDMEGRVTVHKKGTASQEFLEDNDISKAISDPLNQILCGHNRWATTGALDDKGAHPFQHGKITMFHNGTLDSWGTLTKKYFTIDSEAICASLNERGAKETLEELDGAYALVWYNSEEETINFARNKERPLFFATMDGSESLMYASEKGMIEWLAGRNEIKLKEIKSLSVGQILSIPVTTNGKAKVTPFTVKVSKTHKWETYYNTGYQTNYSKPTYPTHTFTYIDGCVIEVEFDTFLEYAYSGVPQSKYYGYISGTYKDCVGNEIEVRSGGHTKDDAENFFKEDKTLVRVTSVSNNEYIFASILSQGQSQVINISEIRRIADEKAERAHPPKKDLVVSQKTGGGVTTTDVNATIVGPNGLLITADTFDLLTKNGCDYCSKDLHVYEQFDVFWGPDNSAFCSTCAIDNFLV